MIQQFGLSYHRRCCDAQGGTALTEKKISDYQKTALRAIRLFHLQETYIAGACKGLVRPTKCPPRLFDRAEPQGNKRWNSLAKVEKFNEKHAKNEFAPRSM